ncbi:MAG: DUF4190 domain-containing protein [Nitrospira sp.]
MTCPACTSQVANDAVKCQNCGFPFGGKEISVPKPPDIQSYVNVQPPARNSSLAVASMSLGILSWLGPSLLMSIPAIITGHMAKREIRSSNGAIHGEGMAMTGLIAGYVNAALSVLFLGWWMQMVSNILSLY